MYRELFTIFASLAHHAYSAAHKCKKKLDKEIRKHVKYS